MADTYSDLVLRNTGYISSPLQKKISQSRLLIAGCGIGSQVAEAAARTGFQNFVLVDGDTISSHNLNRQSFFHDQIGKLKVDALKENILRINPSAKVETVSDLLTVANSKTLVQKSDVVIDTIDFLDLEGIVALHDEACDQKKILVSSFSVGFGAAVVSFPPNSVAKHSVIRDIFGLPASGPVGDVSYTASYIKLFTAISGAIDSTVVAEMQKVFAAMADGKVCPAPQVASGAYLVATACVTSVIRMLDQAPVTKGPEMVVINLSSLLQAPGIALANAT